MRPKPLAVVLVAVGSLLFAGIATAHNGGFTPRDPASPGAQAIVEIYWLLVAISALVLLVVVVPLALFVIRYRHRGRGREIEGPQVRGNTSLELAWTAGPVVLVFVIAAFVFYKLPEVTDAAGAEAHRVRVEGRQFYWQYEYENGVVAIDRLRLPVGVKTELALTAPEGDVIHSFWVPNLAGKRDAVPGEVTKIYVEPRRVGTFDVICGEFCGIQHAFMRGEVEVLERREFDRWLADRARLQRREPETFGAEIWAGVCAKCHAGAFVGEIGPPLEGNPILRDRREIEEIVRRGRGAMPAVGEGWSDAQMRALTTYLRDTIARQGGGGGG